MRILPVASGKGGVGKTLLSANLAIALAQAGKRVVLADLDLGGSNLHLVLGVRGAGQGIGLLLNNPSTAFEDILIHTEYNGLTFVAGDAEIPGIANLASAQKNMLVRRLSKLDADYLVLDLGAGTNFNILDFFLMSGRGIVVTTPTPTATVNAYLFLKNAVFRIINRSVGKKSPALGYLEQVRKTGTSFQRVYIPELLAGIRRADPAAYQSIAAGMGRFRPRLVLNMLEDPKDADKANRLRRSCDQYLDLELEHLGVVYRDDFQDIALSSQLPIVIYKPESVLAQAVFRIADKIIQLGDDGDEVAEVLSVEESYEAAGMEAEIDYESKLDHVSELLHSGALTTADLIETVKMQQVEISTIRKENMLLKSKLLKAASQGYTP